MMPAYWEQYQAYIREHERTFIAESLPLFEQPSVSHQAADVRRCAALLQDMLQHEGVHAAIMETGGNPVVYGEIEGERDDVTVVLYNHYDVKPVEPLEAWHSEPFRPLFRRGRVEDQAPVVPDWRALSPAELRSLTMPACIVPGNDRVHPREPGQVAHRLMPNAEYVEVVSEQRATLDEAFADWDAKEGLLAATFIDFLRRHRGG